MQALIIVDVQYDFLPGGALGVAEGDVIIPVINQLQEHFNFIVATQDWHPMKHGSFAANHKDKKVGEFVELSGVNQILWPVHCVQNSRGADFHDNLNKKRWAKIFQKGTELNVDSYSGFYDNNHKNDTGLAKYLKKHQITKVYVVGLATDYCVKYTVLDAIKEGFETYLIKDATKPVNLKPTDFDDAIQEMEAAGANIITSAEIINPTKS